MKPLTFRSTAARVGAWTWLVFAALNFIDIAVRGRNLAAVVAAAVLLTGCGLAYVFGLRPRITANEQGIKLRNPLRDIEAPWTAVQKLEAHDAVMLTYTDAAQAERTARAWVLQSTPRARAREERRARREQRNLPPGVAEQVAGRTPTEFAVQQLNELSDRNRPKRKQLKTAETGTMAWSPTALAALAVPATLLAMMIVIAVAR